MRKMSLERYTKQLKNFAAKKWEEQAIQSFSLWGSVYYFDEDGYGKAEPFNADYKRQEIEIAVTNDKGIDKTMFVPISNLVQSESEAKLEHTMLKTLNKRKRERDK